MSRRSVLLALCLVSSAACVKNPVHAHNVKIIDRVEFVISLEGIIEGKDGKHYQTCKVIGYRTWYADGTYSVENSK